MLQDHRMHDQRRDAKDIQSGLGAGLLRTNQNLEVGL